MSFQLLFAHLSKYNEFSYLSFRLLGEYREIESFKKKVDRMINTFIDICLLLVRFQNFIEFHVNTAVVRSNQFDCVILIMSRTEG